MATKQAKMFHMMCGMLKCAMEMNKLVVRDEKRLVHREVRAALDQLLNKYTNFIGTATDHMPEPDRTTWLNEWIKRDYHVFTSVFALMAEMTDEQRLRVEQYSEKIINEQ